MADEPKPRVVCCIGDIHGYITKLEKLWSNLKSSIPPSDFQTALIIFLGDYCDRGPDTKRVLDFLVSLPCKYPDQSHVFLCGNHDFAFAAFLGVLQSPVDGSSFSETWKKYENFEWWEGWYKGEGYEEMHVQGRRWGGRMPGFQGSLFGAAPTFESYGLPHASPELIKVVPDEHKKFLSNLVWVHNEENVWIETTDDGLQKCRMIAVHAGLEHDKSVDEQLKYLKAKDTRNPKPAALSGRSNVLMIPEELKETSTAVVSGHHGQLSINGLRFIVDECGGNQDCPMAAIVFPSKKIVRDID